jgi:hypothetical protein
LSDGVIPDGPLKTQNGAGGGQIGRRAPVGATWIPGIGRPRVDVS